MNKKSLILISLYLFFIMTLLSFTVIPITNYISNFRVVLIILFTFLIAIFNLKIFNIFKFKTSGFLWLIFFLLIIILGAILSLNITSAIYALWFIFQLIFLIISFYTLGESKKDFLKIFQMFFVVSTFFIVLGLVYTVVNPASLNYRGGNLALEGIFNNNNSFGMVALLNLISTFIYKELKNHPDKNKVFNFILVLISFSIILSSSRAAILGLIVFWISIYLLYLNKSRLSLNIFIFYSIISVTLYMTLTKFKFIFDLFRLEDDITGTIGSRGILFDFVFKSIDVIPILGLGIGMQEKLWGISDALNYSNSSLYGFGFHNSFLQLTVETGLIGLLLFVGILLNVLFGKNNLSILSLKEIKLMKIGILSLTVNGIFESSLILPGTPVSIFYWFLIILLIIRK